MNEASFAVALELQLSPLLIGLDYAREHMKVLICLKVLLEGPTINLGPGAFKMLISKHTERMEVLLQIPHHVIKLAAALGVHSIHQLVRWHDDLARSLLRILHLKFSSSSQDSRWFSSLAA